MKGKEPILYTIFGVLTTVVNLLSYQAGLWIGLTYGAANSAAFVIAIIFAYVTNKTMVFESKQADMMGLVIEFLKFMAARLGTFVIEMAGLWLLIDQMGFNDILPKYLMTAVVIVLNYFLSKWFIFKKPTASL